MFHRREAVQAYAYTRITTNHHVAPSRCPKELFQGFFVGTPLSIALRNLKMSKAVPDRLKPQDCKRGNGQVKPPIPYIQEKDKLQEAVESTASIKLTLPTKVELRVSVRSCGTPENMLLQPSRQRATRELLEACSDQEGVHGEAQGSGTQL